MLNPIDVALRNLGIARQKLAAFRFKNIDVFKAADDLGAEAAAAEAAFKEIIRPTGTKELKGHGLSVSIAYPQSISYDGTKLLAAQPSAIDIPGVIIKTVDTKALERAVSLGQVHAVAAEAARIVVQQTPRMTVKDDPTQPPAVAPKGLRLPR